MTTKMKCIILDDEPIGREILENYIQKVEYLECVNSFEDPIEALLFLQANPVDLLITDINMPQINGIDLVKSLQNQLSIIFVTAHRDFALDGFETGAIDYLVKPVRFDRFLKATNRAYEQFKLQKNLLKPTDRAYIFVKVNGKLEKINFEQIVYIEAQGDYLNIITTSSKILTLATLKSFE